MLRLLKCLHFNLLRIPFGFFFFRFSCRKASSALLFILLCFLGGFPDDNIAKPKLKRIWWTVSLVTIFLYGIIIPIGYVFTVKNISRLDMMYLLAMIGLLLHLLIIVQTVTIVCRSELETVLKFIDEFHSDYELEKSIINAGRIKYDTIDLGTKVAAIMILMALPYGTSGFIYTVFFCNRTCLNESQSYIFPIPYLDTICSYRIYILTQMIALPTFISGLIVGFSIVSFHIMIGWEFQNISLNLCAHFHNTFNETIQRLTANEKEVMNFSVQQHVRMKEYVKIATESDVFRMFKKNIADIVERHNKIIRLV